MSTAFPLKDEEELESDRDKSETLCQERTFPFDVEGTGWSTGADEEAGSGLAFSFPLLLGS